MKRNLMICASAFLLFALGSVPMWSQLAPVEGKVTDSGKPLPNAVVTLTNIGTNRTFKVKTDKNGNFSMAGVPVADYEVEITSATGDKLYKQKQTVAPEGADPTVQLKIDVSAGQQPQQGQSGQQGQGQTSQGQTGQGASGQPGQQQPKYTKEQIEEIRKQNAKAESFNAIIKQANDAIAAKNWQAAIGPLQQLIATDPNNWQYYSGLGDSQFNLAQYDDAVQTYQKGIEVAESITTVDPKNPATDPTRKKSGEAHMLTSQGNAYLKLHKNNEAVAAYTKAAGLDPNPATAYFNLCATQYNTGNTDGALDACDKAIAADPNKADAYFIKGSLLVAGSKQDKDGKIIAPPGTSEALNKYLQLAPDGPHSKDVKDMLAYIGSKVETTYKKGK